MTGYLHQVDKMASATVLVMFNWRMRAARFESACAIWSGPVVTVEAMRLHGV
jgi:hypothetical protein